MACCQWLSVRGAHAGWSLSARSIGKGSMKGAIKEHCVKDLCVPQGGTWLGLELSLSPSSRAVVRRVV